jgi:hypothetical protein
MSIVFSLHGMRLSVASEPIHAQGILEDTLSSEKCLEPVDPTTVEHADEDEKELQSLEP